MGKSISVLKGISPCKMTCNILVLFSNDAETVAMELVNRFENVAINTICVSNVAPSQRLSSIRFGTKAKIHVIFFSPEFLSFLENSPLDAYYICGQLDTKSTLAVFCLGSKESDVFCYHMAPLKSFISWRKFEMKDAAAEGSAFPQELLKRIQEVIAEDVNRIEDIVIVPQFLKRHNRSIYVIFSSPTEGVKDVTVHLNDQREIDIHLEKINPYVMKFSVPDYLFLFSHNVTVRVESKGHIITKKVIHLSQDAPKQVNGAAADCARPSTQEEMYLDEQIKFLTNFSGLAPDEENTITTPQPEDHITEAEKLEERDKKLSRDLRDLCMQYGLEELSFLISDPPVFSREYTLRESCPRLRKHSDPDIKLRRDSLHMCLLPEMDSSHRMNSFLIEKSDHPRLFAISRSLSLPSTLLSTSDDRDSYGLYMDMGGGESTEMKPHEKLLMDMRCRALMSQQSNGGDSCHKEHLHSLSSEQYVSLLSTGDQELDIRAILKKGLSDSQQELLDLMHNFKEGECTLSNVEQQFQLWRERHYSSQGQAKRSRKTSAFVLPWRKKKDSKSKERLKQVTNSNDPKTKEEQGSARKISDTSASSASSKASEKSHITVSSKGEDKSCNELKCDDLGITNTGWVSTYSPTSNRNYCPLYPEKNPPPLPLRPPPSPKFSQIMKPVPLPRRKLPADAKKEGSQVKASEKEKSPDQTLDPDETTPEEYTNVSIVDFCQKFGLVTLGECFASGLCPFQEQMPDGGRNQRGIFGTRDSDGYEMPIKLNLRNRDETGAIGSIRRSISLPSDLNQNFEFPEDAVLHRSDDILKKDKDPCSCDHCSSIEDSFTSNIYMSLLEFQRDGGGQGKQILSKEGLSKSQQELLDLMYAFKSGDQTISQVEHQFQDWLSRHKGKCTANFVLGQNIPEKCKTRKQAAFGLPVLKNLILGKPRKKSSHESKVRCSISVT
ncbi:DBB domain-containing protein [Nephila pilipes]|uniref:DBB domain-containing protein n=1 Tax=Nephila pilipes TaxID=299642 RepID=A0A8X6N3G1_NEPPI|nr:DBB domain-containing protein [Nephila pilipes]